MYHNVNHKITKIEQEVKSPTQAVIKLHLETSDHLETVAEYTLQLTVDFDPEKETWRVSKKEELRDVGRDW